MTSAQKFKIISSFCLIFFIASCSKNNNEHRIIIAADATSVEQLAAKELTRYIYLRTGNLPAVVKNNSQEIDLSNAIILKKDLSELKNEEYIIKTISNKEDKTLTITGGDDYGVLYGTYRYLETLGIQFHLHDDVIPDEKIKLEFGNIEIKGKPIFAIRGIQPFHDFPEGPDVWNVDDYKMIISQLPKMGMNFIGFHTYPENKFTGYSRAEPMVWIGQKENINEDGTVKSAYPIMHWNCQDSTWGYTAKKTSDYSFGASELFDTDNFATDYMKTVSPWSHTDAENITIFNDFGKILNNSFSFAKKLGVKTCIGTEIPLSIPVKVSPFQKVKPLNEKEITEIYEGIFTRIMKTHPLDHYWFWTPEGWTWEGEKQEDVIKTEKHFQYAINALKNVKAPFTLATCGWVLGPSKDRAVFDKLLPKDMPFSCINREVGFTPIEEGFKNVEGRPKWAIPWMEDDPALTTQQLWVGRARKDAVEALQYGCTGLIGIHWRTENLSPQFSALAKAGWELGDWKDKGSTDTRDLPTEDFYNDWAKGQFGKEASAEIAKLFVKLDGGPLFNKEKNKTKIANIPRTADWALNGPGGLLLNYKKWEEVKSDFAFVDEFEKYENQIKGKMNKERYNYWLTSFKYVRKMAEVGCVLGELDTLMKQIKVEKDKNNQLKMVEEKAFPLKKSAEEKWGEMVTLLLEKINTWGEIGTIANLEMHNLGQLKLLTKYDELISEITKKPAPALDLPKEYNGISRLIVPTKRNILQANEDLNIKAIILSKNKLKDAKVYWRKLGKGKFETVDFTHSSRGVYNAVISASAIKGNDIEYFIDVNLEGEKLLYPAAAPEICQSVVVWE